MPAYARRQAHPNGFGPWVSDGVEILVTLRGGARCRAGAGQTHLRRGTVLLLAPGTTVAAHECRSLVVYHGGFRSALLTAELAWMTEDPLTGQMFADHADGSGVGGGADNDGAQGGRNGFRLWENDLQQAVAHLEALEALRGCPLPAYRADLLGRLAMLLGTLARAAQADRVARLDRGRGSQDGLNHPAVGDALQILETQLTREWTLTDLAESIGLTPSYVSRLFKGQLGEPPMAYLARRRAETAAELLLRTDAPVSEIAESVGWIDRNYFARRFKAHFGVTPSEYRQGERGGHRNRRPAQIHRN